MRWYRGIAQDLPECDPKMKAEYNRSLRIYLKDYLRNETAAFPILLEGPWGCGKTYFIGRLIEELKSGGRTVLYVSLNGVSCTEELERAILAAFAPNAAMGLGRLLLGAGRLQGCLGKGVGDVINLDIHKGVGCRKQAPKTQMNTGLDFRFSTKKEVLR